MSVQDRQNFPFIFNYISFLRPSAGNINFNHIGTALLEAIDHSVTANPFNPTFLKTQGDTFYGVYIYILEAI